MPALIRLLLIGSFLMARGTQVITGAAAALIVLSAAAAGRAYYRYRYVPMNEY